MDCTCVISVIFCKKLKKIINKIKKTTFYMLFEEFRILAVGVYKYLLIHCHYFVCPLRLLLWNALSNGRHCHHDQGHLLRFVKMQPKLG